MKKGIAMLLVGACLLSIAGCQKPQNTEDPDPSLQVQMPGLEGGGTILLTTEPTVAPTTEPTTEPTVEPTTVPTTAPPCEHSFTEWTLNARPTCIREGAEIRRCTICNTYESRKLPFGDHDFAANNVCRDCKYVTFDPNADIVELGNMVSGRYDAGAIANCAWDLVVWDGVLYRTSGDYDKNSGIVAIWGYNIETQTWKMTGEAKEEALHRFVQLGSVLASPGVDPEGGWDWGNFYALVDGAWIQYRNLPNGVHNFDMIEFDGKIFAGLGVEAGNSPCVMSTDMGQTFQPVPLYKDGVVVDTTGQTYIRIYEYMVYQNQLYAMAYMGNFWGFYRFETDKFVYVSSASLYSNGNRTNYNYLNAKFEFNDTCFVVSNYLHAIKDFTDPDANKIVLMPNNASVADALVADGVLYTLSYAKKGDGGYETIIYKSATGEADSFTEVLRFDYTVPPCSFTYDNGYFYVGMGSKHIINTANGMILRVKLPE